MRRHGLLAMLEFLHDEEVRAAFYHREDGVAVLVDNQVHLPVPEPPAVCLLRTFVYAYPVPDTRRLGYMPARGTAVILHLMAAVGGKCPTRIVADHPVNGLVGDLHALLARVAGYLLGGPLLSGDERTHRRSNRLTERLPGARYMRSWERASALSRTYLPFFVALRFSSRLTVDSLTPISRAIALLVCLFCFPR